AGPQGTAGVLPPEPARAGQLVRGCPRRAGAPVGPAAGDSSHAAERQLAERGGGRTECIEPPVPEPANREPGGAEAGTGGVATGAERESGGSPLALYHRRCSHSPA